MLTLSDCRERLRPVLSVLVCSWLGIGPVLAASSLWESEPDCCCGSGDACLLGGCDCGNDDARESSPCGGLRSAEDFGGGSTILSFGLHLGLAAQEISENRVESVGQAQVDDWFLPDLPARSLDPPPPRSAAAR